MPFLQDPGATLSLTRVAPAPRLVAEVAKLTHQRLEVSPVLGTQVLMVSVEDAKASDVLAKIAIASTAAWQPIEGGLRLVPDVGARSIEASRERARRLQTIQETLRKRQEEASKAKGAAKPTESAMGGMMGSGSVDAFVPLLDLSAIAAMGSGERIVFATNPNPAQISLRGDASSVIQNWIGEHNRSAKATEGGADEMPEALSGLMKGPLGDRFRRMSRPVTGVPAKVVVVATRGAIPFLGSQGVDVRLEVRAYGSDGAILLEETGTVGAGMMAFVNAMSAAKKTIPIANATPIVYSEDAKAFMGMTGASRLGGGGANAFSNGVKMPASLREKLFAPQEYDPLAMVPGEGLVALAKARRKPLVACLPDSALPGLLDAAPKTVEEMEEKLKTGPMCVVPDSDYLLIKPTEPDTARRTQVDRNALTTLMRAIADHEVPTLDELADFATRSPSPSQNEVTSFYLMTFAPNTMSGISGMVSWDGLRVYAGLTPMQRQSLVSGERVAFRDLSAEGRSSLSSMLYGASDTLQVDRPGVSMVNDPVSRGIQMAIGGGGLDVRDEPTEIAPQGLPANGYLQAAVESDTILRPITTDGPSRATLDTEELATIRMLSTGPMAEQVGDSLRLPESARLGTRRVWNLRGYVAEGAYVAATLTDDRTPKDGATVTLGSLPPDLQAKVAEKTEQMKKSPLGAIMALAALMGKPAAKP